MKINIIGQHYVVCKNCGIIQNLFLDDYSEGVKLILGSINSSYVIQFLSKLSYIMQDAKWKYIKDFELDHSPSCPECGGTDITFQSDSFIIE